MRMLDHVRRAALAAMAVLAATTGVASAHTFSVSERSFRGVWIELAMVSGAGVIRCNVTLEGSFHAGTFAKVAGRSVGSASRFTTSCPALIDAERLPWALHYESFSGTLPTISGISLRLPGMALSTTIFSPCPATAVPGGEGEVHVPRMHVSFNALGGATAVEWSEGFSLVMEQLGGECPWGDDLAVAGVGSFRSPTRILTLTLI